MKAMVFNRAARSLQLKDIPMPQPAADQVRMRVSACGVCRTDLHIVEGDLTDNKNELIPGHQIVGYVDKIGTEVSSIKIGQRVGVSWLGKTCNDCEYCAHAQENLCDRAQFTGYHLDGGFAEYCVASEQACYRLPQLYRDHEIAPLLCAGLIGYRAYQMAAVKAGDRIGLYGFGAAAHIISQLAKQRQVKVFGFTRSGDSSAQQLALNSGADWVGSSLDTPPEQLNSAIIFAPVGALVPQALKQLRKGGKVVCAGIHMSPIPEFSYDILWGERSICSVANLTRNDGLEFLQIAGQLPIHTHTQIFSLEQANCALELMAKGELTGAAVISMGINQVEFSVKTSSVLVD